MDDLQNSLIHLDDLWAVPQSALICADDLRALPQSPTLVIA